MTAFCHEIVRKKYHTHKLPYLGVHALGRPVLEAFKHLVGVHVFAEEAAKLAQEKLVHSVFLDLFQVNANDVPARIASSAIFQDLGSYAQWLYYSIPPALIII